MVLNYPRNIFVSQMSKAKLASALPWHNLGQAVVYIAKMDTNNISIGGDGDGDSSIFRKLKFKTNS